MGCLDIDDRDSVEARGCTAFGFIYNGQSITGEIMTYPRF